MASHRRRWKITAGHFVIEHTDAHDAFHRKLDGTGLADENGTYALPIVELAGRASMRPNPDTVADQFRDTQ